MSDFASESDVWPHITSPGQGLQGVTAVLALFLMQSYCFIFRHPDLLQSAAKFVQAESSEKLAYSLPRRSRTKGAKATKVRASRRRGMKASVATAARSISAACDEGEVYLPQRSVL